MIENKKIDILMATYNGEKYLAEQIDSIICQTYKNWNLLIRDDGSSDNTFKIWFMPATLAAKYLLGFSILSLTTISPAQCNTASIL